MTLPGTDDDHDVFRDGPLRYLGYSNELGESFRGVAPPAFVTGTCASSAGRALLSMAHIFCTDVVAFAYVLADSAHKSRRTWQLARRDPNVNPAQRTALAAMALTDTLMWQTLASVAIPGFTINRVCAASAALLRRTSLRASARQSLVSAIGLSTIPLIVQPIDHGVHLLLDATRRRSGQLVCEHVLRVPLSTAVTCRVPGIVETQSDEQLRREVENPTK